MFVTNWISTTKIQKISEITNFFRHYFLSRTEVNSSHAFLWGAIPTYLEFLWTNEGLTTTNARDVSPVVMTAFDLDTNNVYYFNVDSTEFPYGILN